jgi:SAM-dependent methyltransferase
MVDAKSERMTKEDFCTMFRCLPAELPEAFLAKFDKTDMQYRPADPGQREAYFLNVLQKIFSPYVVRSRRENLDAFEKGWRENLALLKNEGVTAASLKPLYFRPSPYLRYRNGLIVSENPGLEYDVFTLARMILFNKYLALFNRVYELGCGSGQNLFMLTQMFPEKVLCGLDWTSASAEIANQMGKALGRPISGMVFDMMAASRRKLIPPGSAVITIHALEQIGKSHDKLLAWLLASRPGIVLHYEPVLEFYNPSNLLDYLALSYCQRRNYLCEFLPALKRLEQEGRIEILGAWRPGLGGVIHEAALIIWRPVAAQKEGQI